MQIIFNGTATARSMFGLDGKTVLITGASQGIGRAVAQSCAEAGARVIISGRDVGRLQATFDSLAGDGHRLVMADLTDMNALKHLAIDCGFVDGVVHSAGIRGLSPMRMVSDDFLREVMEVNYIAPMMLTRHLLSRSAIRPGGSIIFMSSIAAVTGTVGVGPYSGSKAALVGALRPLALEIAKRGIRANAFAPGVVETPLTDIGDNWLDTIRKSYPLDIGQPNDVALSCLFFLSDASSKVTGTLFNLDGGVEYT